jgi:dTDP-D-glucose 4,6-dehydratase
MTKVLVSGSGGFVAHHFLEHLLATTNFEVVCTDSFRHKGKTDRIAEVLENQPNWTYPNSWAHRTTVITHDLTVPFSEQAIDKMGQIDYIVAFASESHVDRSITDPVPFVRNNVDVALNTLELARTIKPKSLVWISTDEVYGPITAEDPRGHAEWSRILPSNPYAGSKAAQEAIAISYWRTYGVPLQLVNCFDMQTRVMTPDGPKRHDELKLRDRVWSMDAEGHLVAERLYQLFRRPGPCKMVRINARGSSQLVTHDHRIMLQRPIGSPRRWQPVEETTAGKLLSVKGRVRVPRTADWKGSSSSVVYPYDHFTPSSTHGNRRHLPEELPSAQVAALFGWYVSEGTTNGGGSVHLCGDKPGQQEAMSLSLASIPGTIKRHEPSPNELSPSGNSGSYIELSNADLADWLRTAGRLQSERRVPAFIKGMAVEYLRGFFEAACAGDGTQYANGGVYYTSSEALAWDMAEIAMKLGFSARVSTRETWNPAKTVKKLSWIMRYSPQAGTVEARNVTEVSYDGDVWCLSVPSGRVFIERDGIVSLSGQCMNMFGERQDPEKFIPSTIAKVNRGETVTIHGTEDHIGSRYYLHARNLADGVLSLLMRKPATLFGQNSYDGEILVPDRYNIVPPDRFDNLTMAKMIAEYVGKPLRYELVDFHSTRPGHDPHYGLDGSKLRNLGWQMPVPFEESLERTVKWSLEHPEWLL